MFSSRLRHVTHEMCCLNAYNLSHLSLSRKRSRPSRRVHGHVILVSLIRLKLRVHRTATFIGGIIRPLSSFQAPSTESIVDLDKMFTMLRHHGCQRIELQAYTFVALPYDMTRSGRTKPSQYKSAYKAACMGSSGRFCNRDTAHPAGLLPVSLRPPILTNHLIAKNSNMSDSTYTFVALLRPRVLRQHLRQGSW